MFIQSIIGKILPNIWQRCLEKPLIAEVNKTLEAFSYLCLTCSVLERDSSDSVWGHGQEQRRRCPQESWDSIG